MSSAPRPDMSREEAEALLPWLVTGRLSGEEKAAVEAQLATHPDMQAQFVLIEEDAAATRQANEALGVPSAGALERLMRSIEAEASGRRGLAGLGGALSAWLDGLRERGLLAPLAMAAMVLIAAETVLLAGLMIESPGKGYETASGPGVGEPAGTVALVGFQPGASLADIEAALAEAGFLIADGPRAGGIYALRPAVAELPAAELSRRLAVLEERSKVIRFVAPAGP